MIDSVVQNFYIFADLKLVLSVGEKRAQKLPAM